MHEEVNRLPKLIPPQIIQARRAAASVNLMHFACASKSNCEY